MGASRGGGELKKQIFDTFSFIQQSNKNFPATHPKVKKKFLFFSFSLRKDTLFVSHAFNIFEFAHHCIYRLYLWKSSSLLIRTPWKQFSWKLFFFSYAECLFKLKKAALWENICLRLVFLALCFLFAFFPKLIFFVNLFFLSFPPTIQICLWLEKKNVFKSE